MSAATSGGWSIPAYRCAHAGYSLSPLRPSDEVNDKVHIIGCANGFEHNLVGNEQGCGAAADKNKPLAKIVS